MDQVNSIDFLRQLNDGNELLILLLLLFFFFVTFFLHSGFETFAESAITALVALVFIDDAAAAEPSIGIGKWMRNERRDVCVNSGRNCGSSYLQA